MLQWYHTELRHVCRYTVRWHIKKGWWSKIVVWLTKHSLMMKEYLLVRN